MRCTCAEEKVASDSSAFFHPLGSWCSAYIYIVDARSSMSATGRVTGFTGHPVGETKTNLCVGMDKGKPLTKRALPTKQVSKKGRIQKRVKFVRDIVREVVGYAPYEKRCMELLKVGKEKRALKVRAPPPFVHPPRFPSSSCGVSAAPHLSSGQPTFPRRYYDLRTIVPLPPPS